MSWGAGTLRSDVILARLSGVFGARPRPNNLRDWVNASESCT